MYCWSLTYRILSITLLVCEMSVDAEAETPILWPPDAKNWLTGEDPDAGKDWEQEEKGMTEDEVVEWHHWLSGHDFEKLQKIVKDREAWHAAVHGVTKKSYVT